MNFKQFLAEMPIQSFQLKGQWDQDKRAYGYSPQDVAILKNPKAVYKIQQKWYNSKMDFSFIFLRSFQGMKQLEVGEVDSAWVKEKLGIDVEPQEDVMTVIFTQNRADEKIPMTAWTIAHRLGHAVRRDDLFNSYFAREVDEDMRTILKDCYGVLGVRNNSGDGRYVSNFNPALEKSLKALATAIGTMKSARNDVLRNYNEFHYELVAQWIITGNIKFNPLPQALPIEKRFAWGNPNHKYVFAKKEELPEFNKILEGHADRYSNYLESIFNNFSNRIFVM